MTGISRLLLILIAVLPLAADDHYVESRRGAARSVERWVGNQRVWSSNGRVNIIKRFDLEREWVVDPAKNRYLERILVRPAECAPQSLPVRLLDAECGWEPVAYEWQFLDTGRIETVDGHACRVVCLEGDSDYARKRIQLWVDPKAPVDMVNYTKLVRSQGMETTLLAVYGSEPLLQRGAVIKSLKEEEHHFGAPRTEETRIKVCRAEAPTGKYELPKDCRKVATQAELIQ